MTFQKTPFLTFDKLSFSEQDIIRNALDLSTMPSAGLGQTVRNLKGEALKSRILKLQRTALLNPISVLQKFAADLPDNKRDTACFDATEDLSAVSKDPAFSKELATKRWFMAMQREVIRFPQIVSPSVQLADGSLVALAMVGKEFAGFKRNSDGKLLGVISEGVVWPELLRIPSIVSKIEDGIYRSAMIFGVLTQGYFNKWDLLGVAGIDACQMKVIDEKPRHAGSPQWATEKELHHSFMESIITGTLGRRDDPKTETEFFEPLINIWV